MLPAASMRMWWLIAAAVCTNMAHGEMQTALECECNMPKFTDAQVRISCTKESVGTYVLKDEDLRIRENLGEYTEENKILCKQELLSSRTQYEQVSDTVALKLHNVPRPWTEARAACQKEGADLVVPDTQELLVNAVTLLRAHRAFTGAWIGASDLAVEGTYRTLNGTSVGSLSHLRWSPGEPNNEGEREDCLGVDTDGRLHDVDCAEPFAFICQRYTQQ